MTSLPDLVCILLCFVACYFDLRTRRIPNWLTFTTAVSGLLLNSVVFIVDKGLGVGLTEGLVAAIVGGLLLFLSFGLLGAIRFVGMGDVKLMAGVGTLLRWPSALWALAYVTLSGGIIALGYALVKGRLGKVMGNIFSISKGWVKTDAGPEVELHQIPYAMAIFMGVVWTVTAKYLPVLRFP